MDRTRCPDAAEKPSRPANGVKLALLRTDWHKRPQARRWPAQGHRQGLHFRSVHKVAVEAREVWCRYKASITAATHMMVTRISLCAKPA
eukprot:scaffold7449_cov430-Prasinococcus_capsulatus_cf.AAC.3